MSTRVFQIPSNHNVTGTCGACGAPVVSPMLSSGSVIPDEHCAGCGRRPIDFQAIAPTYGPVREMAPLSFLKPTTYL